MANRAHVDTLWNALAGYLATRGDAYNGAAALREVDTTTDAAWEVAREHGVLIRRVLSPVQRALLPQVASLIINAPDTIKLRFSFAQ